jgi:hypothetical protein
MPTGATLLGNSQFGLAYNEQALMADEQDEGCQSFTRISRS